MEVGPTTHYIMGGIRVDSDTQMSTLPGLFAAGECAAGINGANRLGGNSLSDLLVFGKRAGEYAAAYAGKTPPGKLDTTQVENSLQESLEPFEKSSGENPFEIQRELQNMMQDLVGIVRTESEMVRALQGLQSLWRKLNNVSVSGSRDYNSGWHTAIDLKNMLTVSEAIARSALERKESRGGHFREDYAKPSPEFAKLNVIVKKAPDGSIEVRHVPTKELPPELKTVLEENA